MMLEERREEEEEERRRRVVVERGRQQWEGGERWRRKRSIYNGWSWCAGRVKAACVGGFCVVVDVRRWYQIICMM
jgi:hypothetical protein